MTVETEMAEHKILASSGQRPRILQCIKQSSKMKTYWAQSSVVLRVEKPYIKWIEIKEQIE